MSNCSDSQVSYNTYGGDTTGDYSQTVHPGFINLYTIPTWVAAVDLTLYSLMACVVAAYIFYSLYKEKAMAYLGFHVMVGVFAGLRFTWALMVLVSSILTNNEHNSDWKPARYAGMYVACGLGFCSFFTSFQLVMSQMNQNMKGKAGTSPLVRGLYIVGNIVLYVFVIVVAVEASHSCCYDLTSDGEIVRYCNESVDHLMLAADLAITIYTFFFAIGFLVMTLTLERKADEARRDYFFREDGENVELLSSMSLLSSSPFGSESKGLEGCTNGSINGSSADLSKDYRTLTRSNSQKVGSSSLQPSVAAQLAFERDLFLVWVVCVVCVVCFTARCLTFLIGYWFATPDIVILLFGYWIPEIPCSILFLYVMQPPGKGKEGGDEGAEESEGWVESFSKRISLLDDGFMVSEDYRQASHEQLSLIPPTIAPVVSEEMQMQPQKSIFEISVSISVRVSIRPVVVLLKKSCFKEIFSEANQNALNKSGLFMDTGLELDTSPKLIHTRSQSLLRSSGKFEHPVEDPRLSALKGVSKDLKDARGRSVTSLRVDNPVGVVVQVPLDLDRTEVILRECQSTNFLKTLRVVKWGEEKGKGEEGKEEEEEEEEDLYCFAVFHVKQDDPENLQVAELIGEVEVELKELKQGGEISRPILLPNHRHPRAVPHVVGEICLNVFETPVCCPYELFSPVQMMAGYLFKDNLRVHEHLEECPYTFTVPIEMLNVLAPHRNDQLNELKHNFAGIQERFYAESSQATTTVFGGVMETVRSTQEKIQESKWYQALLRAQTRHVDAINLGLRGLSRMVGEGKSFKSSARKAEVDVMFAPTNLHLHSMHVLEPGFRETVYSFVTVGAPAAHVYKFKHGLRQLVHSKLKKQAALGVKHGKYFEEGEEVAAASLHREISEIDHEMQNRMDVVICQALPALVSSFVTELKQNYLTPVWIEQLLVMGFFIQFESLLSTHGPETGMLGDFDVAVSVLSRFKIRLACATDLHPEGSVGITRSVEKNFSFGGKEPQAGGLPTFLKVFDPETDISVLFQDEQDHHLYRPSGYLDAPVSPLKWKGERHPRKRFSERSKVLSLDSFEDLEPEEEEEDKTEGEEGKEREEDKKGEETEEAEVRGTEDGEDTGEEEGEAIEGERDMMHSYEEVEKGKGKEKHHKRAKKQEARLLRDLIKLRTTHARKDPPGIFSPSSNDTYTVTIFCSPEMFSNFPPILQKGQKIEVVPMLFTQGINEQQTVANFRGECTLQEEINKENLLILGKCYLNYRKFAQERGKEEQISKMDAIFHRICRVVGYPKAEKNTEILPITSDFCHILGAGRVTCCKSAKDRTSMSITWEEARLLQKHHNLVELGPVTGVMRTNGVRRENAEKNIGTKKFAFNPLQLFALPIEYRPPKIAGGARQS